MVELKAIENTLRQTHRQELYAFVGDEAVGCVGLYAYDPVDMRAEFGLLIHEDYRGRGYGRQVAEALVEYCRETLRLHQIYCDIAVGNAASLALFSKLGFQRCGTFCSWTSTPEGWADAVRLQLILD